MTGNDVGIASAADSASISSNTVQNNRYVGILVNDGNYTPSNNKFSGGLVAIAALSDGFVASPMTVSLVSNNLHGAFATAGVQIVTFSGAPDGGPNAEPITMNVDGFTETVSGGRLPVRPW